MIQIDRGRPYIRQFNKFLVWITTWMIHQFGNSKILGYGAYQDIGLPYSTPRGTIKRPDSDLSTFIQGYWRSVLLCRRGDSVAAC